MSDYDESSDDGSDGEEINEVNSDYEDDSLPVDKKTSKATNKVAAHDSDDSSSGSSSDSSSGSSGSSDSSDSEDEDEDKKSTVSDAESQKDNSMDEEATTDVEEDKREPENNTGVIDAINPSDDVENILYVFNNNLHPIHKIEPRRKSIKGVIADIRETSDFMSVYEYTEIIAMRASQINKTAVAYGKVDVDAIIMAENELKEKKCPVFIKRHVEYTANDEPIYELWSANELALPST